MKFKKGQVIKDKELPSSQWKAIVLDTNGNDYRIKLLQATDPTDIGWTTWTIGFSGQFEDDCEIDEEYIIDQLLKKYK